MDQFFNKPRVPRPVDPLSYQYKPLPWTGVRMNPTLFSIQHACWTTVIPQHADTGNNVLASLLSMQNQTTNQAHYKPFVFGLDSSQPAASSGRAPTAPPAAFLPNDYSTTYGYAWHVLPFSEHMLQLKISVLTYCFRYWSSSVSLLCIGLSLCPKQLVAECLQVGAIILTAYSLKVPAPLKVNFIQGFGLWPLVRQKLWITLWHTN
jgi:hypothetical protein